MQFRVGMIITDIAHVGKYEVLGIFLFQEQMKIKLKRISDKKVLAEDEEGILRISFDLFNNSFVEVDNPINSIENSSSFDLLEEEEESILEVTPSSKTENYYPVENSSNWGCVLPTIILIVAVVLPFIYFPLIIITIVVFMSLIKHMLGGNNKYQ